jgi:hypothetical protein
MLICCAAAGAQLREKLETLQGVATRASEGLHLLAVVGDAYSRAASQAPPELQEKLRAEYTRLRDSYDRLKISVSSAITKLKVSHVMSGACHEWGMS